MDNQERAEALQAMHASISELITADEAKIYPALEHLLDLIEDLRSES